MSTIQRHPRRPFRPICSGPPLSFSAILDSLAENLPGPRLPGRSQRLPKQGLSISPGRLTELSDRLSPLWHIAAARSILP